LGFAQGGQVAGESMRIAQRFPRAEEAESAVGVGFFQSVEEEAPEKSTEDANGEEEAGAAGDPLIVRGQSAAGNHAVEMGVCLYFRRLRATFRVRGDGGKDRRLAGGDRVAGGR